jgi:hypothetical protein
MERPKTESDISEENAENETIGEKRDRLEGFTVVDEGFRKVIITNDLREKQDPERLVNLKRIMYVIVKEREEELKIYIGGEKKLAKNKENCNRPRNLDVAPARYDRNTGQLWLYNEEPERHKQHLSETINRKKDAFQEAVAIKFEKIRKIKERLGFKKTAD